MTAPPKWCDLDESINALQILIVIDLSTNSTVVNVRFVRVQYIGSSHDVQKNEYSTAPVRSHERLRN